MKRLFWPIVISTLVIASPLLAQEPYYPATSGYVPAPAYDAQRDNRKFHFNPSNPFNNMGNPFSGMFGSSNRGYNDYPQGGYPIPPTYPYNYDVQTSPYAQAPRGEKSNNPAPRYNSHPDAATQQPSYQGYANPYAQQPVYDGYPDPSTQQPDYEDYAQPYIQQPSYNGYPDPTAQQPGYEGYANPYNQQSGYEEYANPYSQQPTYDGYPDPYTQQPGYDGYLDSNPAQPPAIGGYIAPYAPLDGRGLHSPQTQPHYGMPVSPNYGEGYRFRPLELTPSVPMTDLQQAPAYETGSMALPSYQEYPPPPSPAPQDYPRQGGPEPLAPLNYPAQTTGPFTPATVNRESPQPGDQAMKFRPLDKPGYSADLEH